MGSSSHPYVSFSTSNWGFTPRTGMLTEYSVLLDPGPASCSSPRPPLVHVDERLDDVHNLPFISAIARPPWRTGPRRGSCGGAASKRAVSPPRVGRRGERRLDLTPKEAAEASAA